MVHGKNWRVSLCVQELCHPQDFLWILAVIPVRRILTGLTVLDRGLRFYLVLDFELAWSTGLPALAFQQVSLTQLRDKNPSHENPPSPPPYLSIHTFAWHGWRCHGWWGRRAWGRRRMINFLPWRCHGCSRGQAWGRTRWQTRNHDRNEVLCVALYPNTVF